MKKFALAAIAALVATAAVAQAAPAASGVPKALSLVTQAGMKIERPFPAPAGLTGWVLSKGGQYSIVYTTADGKYVLAGALIDEAGKNLTADHNAQYVPKVDYGQYWSQLEKSTYIAEGAKNPKTVVYAFMDPDCIFCHLTWKAFQSYEKAGLQVRWLPMGFLKPDSAGKAAALLTSAHPDAALAEHEHKFQPQTESGGIEPMATIPADIQAKLDANQKLMATMGFNGTPAIVYKDARTGKVFGKGGMPSLNDLPAMLNLPEQQITDPELLRFKR
ncbi:thiol:disulfide interchange protein DsbG [Paraburkholderia sp. UCT31]|uniref:thiol:disulfide interchange protein DsbG n=1 Tax=Paraburkholderia sp. UCT31 TaxID=2615209 RepID=UPI001654CBFD|nr:thiol:disulfide interchange protein DsbG [Paraburkholderia sp. UCT31]MBC8737292.1 thiol:disulfide interchange protein DsbG [Paraburkholderia sp. UCT31]